MPPTPMLYALLPIEMSPQLVHCSKVASAYIMPTMPPTPLPFKTVPSSTVMAMAFLQFVKPEYEPTHAAMPPTTG